MILLVIAAVPAFALMLHTDIERRNDAGQEVQLEALRTAHLSADDNEDLIASTRQLLLPVARIFATIPADGIDEIDRASCDRFLADLLDQNANYVNFGLATLDGNVVCSGLPLSAPVNIADRAYFRGAVASGEFTVGDYQIGRITGVASINFGYPVTTASGELSAVVYAALGLAELSAQALDAELPEGSAVTVIGLDGTILARYPDPERWVGSSAEGYGFVPTARDISRDGTTTAPGLDGRERLYAFTPLTDPSGRPVATVVVGIPTAVAFADANAALRRDLIVLSVIALFAFGATWWGAGHYVARPLRALMQAASRLAAGEGRVRVGPPYSRDEVGVLGRAFDEMAVALEARNAELARLNRELEQRVADRTAELTTALSAAERAEAQAEELWSSSMDMQCTASLDGYFLRVNPAFVRVLQFGEDELVRQPFIDFVHPEDRDATLAALGNLGSGAEVLGFQNRYRRKDGEYRWIEWNATPLDAQTVRASARDVTEKKQAEQELEQLAAQLRTRGEELANANAELESFAYSVSHDLRAPLRAITGFSEQLLSSYGEQLDERGRDRLSRVNAGAQRMNGLINDILQLSRTSRAEIHVQPLDLSATAQAVIDELRQGDPERVVDVVIEPGLRAAADAGLVRALLQNLLGNAWKFTSHTDAARVEFGVTEHGGTSAFFVRDNGAGFDAEYADKLFAPFQRLHSPEEFEGTGIGLATVQRIVRRHGGRIWAEGAVGEGAIFYFTLGAVGAQQRGMAA